MSSEKIDKHVVFEIICFLKVFFYKATCSLKTVFLSVYNFSKNYISNEVFENIFYPVVYFVIEMVYFVIENYFLNVFVKFRDILSQKY